MIFLHSVGAGGTERVASALANHWVEHGHKVSIVTVASGLEDRYWIDERVDRISLNLATESRSTAHALALNARRVLALRNAIRRLDPDAVIAMLTTCNVLLACAGTLLGVVKIGSERTYPPRNPLPRMWKYLRVLTYRQLDAVVAVSHESEEWIRHHTTARHVTTIPNPVVWPLPSRAPETSPASVGVRGRKRILAAGRLSEEKGFDMLIEAFAPLVSEFPDWELVIAGEGPAESQLRSSVGGEPAGNIIFAGAVGNIGDWYAAADLFVLTSRFEGFPNALLEAMAHGLPVVSFDCMTGPREIIRHEIDGLLVPEGDVSGLRTALRTLMRDAGMRTALGTNALQVRQRYAMGEIGERWLELTRSLQTRSESMAGRGR